MSEPPSIPIDGESALATVLDEDLVLVAGVGAALPPTVPVLLNGDPAASVRSAVVSWRRAEGASMGFIALVPFDRPAKGKLGSIVLRSSGRPARYALPRRAIGLEAYMQAVAADAGAGFTAVVDGLLEALLAVPSSARRMKAIAALARIAAKPDGVVELLGRFEMGEVFLQGWSASLSQGIARVLCVGEAVTVGELTAGVFTRDDLDGRAHGFAGLLTVQDPFDPAALQRIYSRGRDGWRAIDVYERRVLLEPREVPTHVRAILPRARGTSEVLAALNAASHRFDGRETVSSLPIPVRVGIDMATIVDGGGVLLSGWMLDPDHLVEAVTLRGPAYGDRVDESWTRHARPDVTEAFKSDARFLGRLTTDRQRHGFLAVAVTPAPTAALYLELALRDRPPAYVPIHPARAPARRALARLLASLDPRSTTASSAIEHQFAPMVQAIERPGPRPLMTHDIGAFSDASSLTLVIGADEGVGDIGVLLALLALDPEARCYPIVLSAPAEALDQAGGEIRRLATFYGLKLRLVLGEGVDDICDALEAGVAATSADTLALLSAAVLPREQGWLTRLDRAYRARGGKATVSPTILFEDDSIRWAGTWLDGEGTARTLMDRYVGYPRAALLGAEPMEVTAGTIECCVLGRAAFEAAGGFTRDYLGVRAKSLDLGLKLKLAGTPSVWLPSVEMLAADDDAATEQAWEPLARRVDRITFDRRWSLAVGNLRN